MGPWNPNGYEIYGSLKGRDYLKNRISMDSLTCDLD